MFAIVRKPLCYLILIFIPLLETRILINAVVEFETVLDDQLGGHRIPKGFRNSVGRVRVYIVEATTII